MTTDKPVAIDPNVIKELTAIIAELKPLDVKTKRIVDKATIECIASGITALNTKPPSLKNINDHLGEARDGIKEDVSLQDALSKDKSDIVSQAEKDKALKDRDTLTKLQARVQTVINTINKVGEKTNQDSKPESEKKGEIAEIVTGNTELPSESWGVKFMRTVTNFTPKTVQKDRALVGDIEPESTYDALVTQQGAWYLSLLPAMKSNIPLQGGMDTPGAMPGLNFRVASNVIKHKVIGFHPVYQHLGVDTISCVMVGCFTGADGTAPKTFKADDAYKRRNTYTSNALVLEGRSIDEWAGGMATKYDSFRDFQSFYKFAVQSGAELEVEINIARNAKIAGGGDEDGPFRDGTSGNPKFKGFVKSVNTYYARTDRTWYVIEVEITDAGLKNKDCINLTNDIEKQIDKITPAQEEAATEDARGEDYIECLAKDRNTKCFDIKTYNIGRNVNLKKVEYFCFNSTTAEGFTKLEDNGTTTYNNLLAPKEAIIKLLDITNEHSLAYSKARAALVNDVIIYPLKKEPPLRKKPDGSYAEFEDIEALIEVVGGGLELSIGSQGLRTDTISVHPSGWGVRRQIVPGGYAYYVIRPATLLTYILDARNFQNPGQDIKIFLQYNKLIPRVPKLTTCNSTPSEVGTTVFPEASSVLSSKPIVGGPRIQAISKYIDENPDYFEIKKEKVVCVQEINIGLNAFLKIMTEGAKKLKTPISITGSDKEQLSKASKAYSSLNTEQSAGSAQHNKILEAFTALDNKLNSCSPNRSLHSLASGISELMK